MTPGPRLRSVGAFLCCFAVPAALRAHGRLLHKWGSFMPEPEPTNGAIGAKLDALDKKLDLIWDNHQREHTQHEAAHGREHKFAQDAIETAAKLAAENKADANEWRETMNDRETRFATKTDASTILERLDKIERAGLVAVERETIRVAGEVEEKQEAQRRTARSQWIVGLVVGLLATFGSILINLVIRLADVPK